VEWSDQWEPGGTFIRMKRKERDKIFDAQREWQPRTNNRGSVKANVIRNGGRRRGVTCSIIGKHIRKKKTASPRKVNPSGYMNHKKNERGKRGETVLGRKAQGESVKVGKEFVSAQCRQVHTKAETAEQLH